MDIKSKNIKYTLKFRIAAFCLAFLFLTASGYFAATVVRSFLNYNLYENRRYEETDFFRRLLVDYENLIISQSERRGVTSFEEYKNTTTGKAIIKHFTDEIQKINSCFDLLDNSKIQVYHSENNVFRYRLVNGNVTYYFGYDGSIVSKEQFESIDFVESANNGTYVLGEEYADKLDAVEISQALNYLYELGDDTNYGETSKEILINRKEQECQDSLYASFTNSSSSHNVIENSIKSVKYAVFLTNGNVVTNCKITKEDGYEGALKKIGKGASLIEEFRDGAVITTPKSNYEPSNSVIARMSRELCRRSVRLGGVTEIYGVQSAVFGYSPSFGAETDLFSAFSEINNAIRNSPSGKISSSACIALFAVSFVLALSILIYLLLTAGKSADGETKLLLTNKVPVEINVLFYCGISMILLILICGALSTEYFFGFGEVPLALISFLGRHLNKLIGISFALIFTMLTIFFSSVARNIRAKSFVKNTLCRIIVTPIILAVKKLYSLCEAGYADSSGKKKKFIAISALTVFALLNFVISLFANNGLCLIVSLIINAGAFLFLLKAVDSYSRISQETRKIREGEITKTISTDRLLPPLKKHAEDINSIGDGLQSAVDRAVKDQRMKAELITNVSHDLKTPLTSIVNYVDLLKKCEIEGEDAKKYLNILDEKSQKMKKLIEDLVEASKASSGAVEMHPLKFNLCEFAGQISGENEDELKEKGIDIVLKIPDEKVFVYADAQKTGRIIENLIMNIKKYALENTRAYIEVSSTEKNGIIEFKNISKYELNIPAEELTARFVRGDESRNSEGSGLGLSIASNLCRLQGGQLKLVIDGDLFKAIVILPKNKD